LRASWLTRRHEEWTRRRMSGASLSPMVMIARGMTDDEDDQYRLVRNVAMAMAVQLIRVGERGATRGSKRGTSRDNRI
jgi:hypothetical protein